MNRILIGIISLILLGGGATVVNNSRSTNISKNPPNTNPVTTKTQVDKVYPPVASGDYTKSIVTPDGLERKYLIHIPKNYDPKKQYPVVLGFHGGGGNAEQFKMSSQFSPLADEKGFIVIYGQGTSAIIRPILEKTSLGQLSVWNGGDCCGPAVNSQKNIDDVGYVRAVIKDASANYNINSSRIYATGMSNGGIFSNRLACEASDLLAGIAPVSGTIAIPTCNPSRPIPVLIIHGTSDEKVPYNGGMGGPENNKNQFISVQQELTDWAKRNGCSGQFITTKVEPLVKDGKTIDKITYQGCKQDVVHYRINGGTHEWPSGDPQADLPGKPDPSKALNASLTIASFFGL